MRTGWSLLLILYSLLNYVTAARTTSAAVIAAEGAANRSLFWNTYRPQLYHGIRARAPKSLMTGLMWFGLNDYSGFQEIRHTCEQSDALTSYSYTEHDGRYYAVQDLVDGKNNVKITTSWLKTEDGADWAVRVQGDAIDPSKMSRTSLIYHLGLEGLGSLTLDNDVEETGVEGSIIISGQSPSLGLFRIRIVDQDPSNSPLVLGPHGPDFFHVAEKTAVFGLNLPDGEVWKIKDQLARSLGLNANSIIQSGKYPEGSPPDPAALFVLQNSVSHDANVFAFQKQFGGSGIAGGGKWGFDVFYESLDGAEGDGMSYNALTQSLAAASRAYNLRFDKTFPLPAPYNTPEHRTFAKALTSNLIGGIGYYQGASIVDRSFRHEYDEEEEDDDEDAEAGSGVQKPKLNEERELLTATPSRSFFPRGFYWDEGFHLALIGEWDNDLSLEILKDWIALVDEDGWVAREQILGEESRSKVPGEFQTQYPSYANPPTLAMTVTSFIRRLNAQTSSDLLNEQIGLPHLPSFPGGVTTSSLPSLHLKNPTLARLYLNSIYPALSRHYMWFRRTQRGLLKPFGRKPTSKVEAYRWRGRTANHVLTSGLDDYPRAIPPHVGELHVDLMSWMGFFARTMGEISEFIGQEEDQAEYAKHEKAILANLDDLHWSEEEQMYCDLSVDEDDESYHVCHKGYISLFPFLLGLLPASHPNLTPVLDMITSPKHLWSSYGIRSLSKSHPLFGKDENYWRGPIWIQMNWLALKSLKERYMVESGPEKARATKVYEELRKGVIDNVMKEWERTGYVWEQYDAENGEGRRSHPFTGWTSLVTMIMTEKYS